jgi:hypothetical protein
LSKQGKLFLSFWRYVYIMKNFLFFLIFSSVAAGLWAQVTVQSDAIFDSALLEQRRAELRSALKTQFDREQRSKDRVNESISASRHLSEQERADLRLQLRQQRREVKSDF